MKTFKRELAFLFLSATVLVLGFQNCSQNQFPADASELIEKSGLESASRSPNSLSESELDGAANSASAGVDIVTPRIVLSDSYSGSGRKYFSPNKVIYGTVYGVSANAYVCMGWSGCDKYPGFSSAGTGSTEAFYGRPAKELSNWRYQQSDGTWRFVLDYSSIGAIFDRLVVHEPVPKEKTGGMNDRFLRLEQMVHLKSTALDATMYFPSIGYYDIGGYRHPLMPMGSTVVTPSTFRYPNDFSGNYLKIAGVGPNVVICYEKTGSGRCNSMQNYVDVTSYTGGYDRLSTQGVYYVNTYYLFSKLADLGPIDGSYTVHARDASGGPEVLKQLNISQTITCSFRSTTAVIGPCSDPEVSQNQCTKNNVGQTVQGTGTCRAQYVCQCN